MAHTNLRETSRTRTAKEGSLTQNRSSSKSTSSFEQETFNTSSLNKLERNALDNLIKQLGISSKESGQKSTAILDSIVNDLRGGQLTREQAIQDTEGLIGGAARTLAEGDLAKISGQAEAGGASQSALAALLGNDARARTAEQVGSAQIQAIVDFVNSGTQSLTGAAKSLNDFNATPDKAIQELINALGVAKGSQKLGNITKVGNRNEVTNELLTQITRSSEDKRTATAGRSLFSLG